MAAKVEMISKEMIKPSTPTPPSLRTHKLSLLDQITPPVFLPLIFFYQYEVLDNNDRTRKLQSLKNSLSDALTRFYPLAGTLNINNSTVDCNDTGVEFIEAQVHGYTLSQVMENPNIEELAQFLPIHEACGIGNHDVLLAIKVNLFDCEGIAIGVCMSHKVGDGVSLVTFINSWAAIARGDTEIVQPNFNLASLFPSVDSFNSIHNSSIGITNEKLLIKRFVFDKEKIDALKKSTSMASGSGVEDPTRVEAVSAFLWKHFIEASKLKIDSKKTFATIHIVNMRPRMNPTLPDHFFGNLWTVALALNTINSEANKLMKTTSDDDLVYQLRSAIRRINGDYINMVQNKEELLKHIGKLVELFSKGEVEFSCYFTSWSKFPVYEVDFGWGKPSRVCTTTLPYKNMIFFLPTKCGEGIEAYVNMLNEDVFSQALT